MEVVPGRYQHFKGHYCNVIGIAKHTETEEDYVVYTHEGMDSTGRINGMWIRPLAMFIEEVERDGKKMPRFKLVETD